MSRTEAAMKLRILAIIVGLLAATGCHSVPELCAAKAARLKERVRALEREEPLALARIEAKRAAIDDKLDARERAVKAHYDCARRAYVASAAERYRALLESRRATDPAAASAVNKEIAAAQVAFREASERAEASVGVEEGRAIGELEERRRQMAAKLERYRAYLIQRYAAVRARLAREIAAEEREALRRT